MIDYVQIMEAINKVAITGIPEYEIPGIDELEAVYIDITPNKFNRPSLLIQYVSDGKETASRALVRTTEYFTLTVYDETDDYSNSSTIRLLKLQQKVMALFRPGYLQVGDRAIGVQASTGGRDWDKAYIDVQFEFHDLRTEMLDTTPLMEYVETTVQVKE